MRKTFEYWLVVSVARVLGWLPRSVARMLAAGLGWLVYQAMGRLRRVGERNLSLAIPGFSAEDRERTLRSLYRYLGWQLVEFCQMPYYTREQFEHTLGVHFDVLATEEIQQGRRVLYHAVQR